MEKNTYTVSGFSQMQTFVLGIIAGILVLCTIGFFVLLGMVMDDDDATYRGEENDNVAAAPAAPSYDTGGPTAIRIREVQKDEHVRGNKKAKVTLVEFSDLDCPFCSRFHPTAQQLIDNNPDDVNWVYRHFPLTSLHPNATKKAHAVECAGEQGKFWEMTDVLFDNVGGPASDDQLAALAGEAGVGNIGQFQECVSSEKYADKIAADAQDAQAAGGRGTPYSILLGPDGETIPVSGAQPIEAIEAALQRLL